MYIKEVDITQKIIEIDIMKPKILEIDIMKPKG